MVRILFWFVARAFCIDGVVDRVEGAYAIVEWEGAGFEDLPLAWMPRDVRERSHLRACAYLSRRGSWQPTGTSLHARYDDGEIRLPIHVESNENELYKVIFEISPPLPLLARPMDSSHSDDAFCREGGGFSNR